jgi:hypothetical protein
LTQANTQEQLATKLIMGYRILTTPITLKTSLRYTLHCTAAALKMETNIKPITALLGESSFLTFSRECCTKCLVTCAYSDRVWQEWGVDLVQSNIVGGTPKMIFIGLMTAWISNLLALVSSLFAVCSYSSTVSAAIFTALSAATGLVTLGISHTFVKNFVSHANPLEVSGSGQITAQLGGNFDRGSWMSSIIALAGTILWFFISWRSKRARIESSISKHSGESMPFIGIVRRATTRYLDPNGKNAQYKNLGDEEFELGSHSAPQRGYMSREASPDAGMHYDRHSAPEVNTAYEPMRHQ